MLSGCSSKLADFYCKFRHLKTFRYFENGFVTLGYKALQFWSSLCERESMVTLILANILSQMWAKIMGILWSLIRPVWSLGYSDDICLPSHRTCNIKRLKCKVYVMVNCVNSMRTAFTVELFPPDYVLNNARVYNIISKTKFTQKINRIVWSKIKILNECLKPTMLYACE